MMSFNMWDFKTLCFTGRHLAFLPLKWNFSKIQRKLDPIINTSPLPVSGASVNEGYRQNSASYSWSTHRVLRKDWQSVAVILSGSAGRQVAGAPGVTAEADVWQLLVVWGERRPISSRNNIHLTEPPPPPQTELLLLHRSGLSCFSLCAWQDST